MTTKTYLEQIKTYDRMIENKLFDIYRMTSLACGMTVAPKQDKVQTSQSGDKIVNAVIKIMEYESDVNRLVNEMIEKKQHIVDQIDGMENRDYSDVLTWRFVNLKSFDVMPDILKMSRSKVYYTYKNAIKEFEKKYGHEYKNK